MPKTGRLIQKCFKAMKHYYNSLHQVNREKQRKYLHR